jgi:hypothetical protein
MTSLHSFCKNHNLPKTSVRRWLNEAGFDTSEGVSEAAITAALQHFKPTEFQSEASLSHPTEIEIYDGNHRHTLTPPPVPHQINLGTLRDDIPVHAYEQPLAMIEDTLSYIQVRRSAMTQDLETRLHLFQQTEAAAAELQRQVRALELEEMRYQTESRLLGLLQNRATAEMQQHLGKVCGDGSSSSPG